ncbi:mannose-1-phosphate guanylyltransferase [Mesoterricola sediminis]|uniref:mannose-1-phosphate guanylyltransferase n=1 Tax=Mesoterricola sediminis TaxID=2927980 RepID=A0AA48KCV9_9BACT|nr:mannose-1-phosphate guanylyltransferase [Mesoterricola sediminis]BDU75727.1 mannose-1-phosphate guanylyltransferase [Mesoterricola sediminis]
MTPSKQQPRKIAVIMAGGKGTRFWPRSRAVRPKQFLAMVGERTLLNATVDRLLPSFKAEDIYIVTTEALAADTRRMLPELPAANVLVEPEGRNTAPCLALALALIEQRTPEGVMVVLSADSWIGDNDKFLADIQVAVDHAWRKRDLVTFGIRPTYPETGYGYIETEGQGPVLGAQAFREKPNYETAVAYLESGRHFWNAGMFVWTLQDLRDELLRHCPEVLAPLDAWIADGARPDGLAQAYGRLPKLSIDYALMEKSERVAVVPASFRWSDVGSWPAVVEFHEADASGNMVQGDAILIESSNCAVFGGKRLVAGSGLENLIIVDEPDALLICRRDRAQDVKTIVERLAADGRADLL